jgi:hypothetical protein
LAEMNQTFTGVALHKIHPIHQFDLMISLRPEHSAGEGYNGRINGHQHHWVLSF